MDNGRQLSYDSIILASGGTPRNLPFQDGHLKNVFSLRSIEDSLNIKDAIEKVGSPNVVVLGTGFIGMEIAASLQTSGKVNSITVVGIENVPMSNVFGEQVGRALLKLHQTNGIKFELGRKVSNLVVADSKVVGVLLDSGIEIPCDVLIVGIGVTPATEYIKSSSSDYLNPDGSLTVDENLSIPGLNKVFAAGDIAKFKASFAHQPVRIEHWNVAIDQGII